MTLIVNGKKHEFAAETLTIAELLRLLNYTFPNINVKHKDSIIKKDEFENYSVKDGNEILIIHHMCGGC